MTAARHAERAAAPPLDRYLGPGRVVRLAADAVVVVLEDGTLVRATVALAFPYRPVVTDQVLVIGDAKSFFVIGVLEAHGRSELSNPKGVALRAEDGRLRVVGERSIRVSGERVRFESETIHRLAIDAIQTLGACESRVRDVLKVEAAEVDELSQGRWALSAKRVVLKALGLARVKSSTVRLG